MAGRAPNADPFSVRGQLSKLSKEVKELKGNADASLQGSKAVKVEMLPLTSRVESLHQRQSNLAAGLLTTKTLLLVQPQADFASVDDGDAFLCGSCGLKSEYYAVTPCNHIACIHCTIERRNTDGTCIVCDVDAPTVFFTAGKVQLYEKYNAQDCHLTEGTDGINVATQEVFEEACKHMGTTCPARYRKFKALNVIDLEMHVHHEHQKRMCGICLRRKKVLSCAQVLYDNDQDVWLHVHADHVKCYECSTMYRDDTELKAHDCRARQLEMG